MRSHLFQTNITSALLRLISRLPLRVNHAIGSLIGELAWIANRKTRKTTQLNLSLCFPNLPEEARIRLARQSLKETGKSLTELGWLWYRDTTQIDQKIRDIQGQQYLDAARTQQRGLIVLSPHVGSWEFCVVEISKERDPIFLYRPPRQASIEPILYRGRTRFGASLAPLNPKGMKSVLRTLSAGGTVGILPDQEPDMNNGVFAPFFGVPANTITLINRLAHKSDAAIVFTMAERLPKGQGYKIHYFPASNLILSENKTIAATALNQDIERCVQLIPDQYIWSYKRFRLLEDGSRRNYA